MIKSPLRYPGGKSRAIKFITQLIPEFKEYREPFVGGGSVFVYLKHYKSPRILHVLNHPLPCNEWQSSKRSDKYYPWDGNVIL
jgi:site-specific DNA-adenine methylase